MSVGAAGPPPWGHRKEASSGEWARRPSWDLCARVAPCGPGVAGAGGHTVLAGQGGHRQRACQRCTAGLSPRGQL